MYLHLISMSSSRPKDALLSCSVYNDSFSNVKAAFSKNNSRVRMCNKQYLQKLHEYLQRSIIRNFRDWSVHASFIMISKSQKKGSASSTQGKSGTALSISVKHKSQNKGYNMSTNFRTIFKYCWSVVTQDQRYSFLSYMLLFLAKNNKSKLTSK